MNKDNVTIEAVQPIQMRFVGIDPAARKYGCAVCVYCSSERKATFHRFKNPLDAVLFLDSMRRDSTVICIEDSSKINATYRYHKDAGIQNRMSRNAGANQAISKNLVDWCGDQFGAQKVFAISPKQKGNVVTDLALFERICKSEGIALYHDKKLIEDDFVAFHMARIGHQQYVLSQKVKQLK